VLVLEGLWIHCIFDEVLCLGQIWAFPLGKWYCPFNLSVPGF